MQDKNAAAAMPEGFVYVSEYCPEILQDIRYFSDNNFMGCRIDGYLAPRAILTLAAAQALKNASASAQKAGFNLKIYDCYRPQTAVNHFVRWAEDASDQKNKAVYYPDVDKRCVFDLGFIAKRSGHSRGSTVDLTLTDAVTGSEVDMGGIFDFFGERSHPDFKGVSAEQYKNRMLLREIMLSNGFLPLDTEWWHFTLANEPFADTYFDFDVK